MNRKLKNPFDDSHVAVRLIWGSLRFLLFGIVILIFLTGIFLVRARWKEISINSRVTLDEGNPDLGAAERLFLQTLLASKRQELKEPISAGNGMVEFEITAGQNANQIALNLVREGLLLPNKESLMLNYLQFYGLDSQLVAGKFQISPQMDIPTLVGTLVNPTSQDITLIFLEGWRSEQYADYLASVQPAKIDPEQFLAIIRREIPVDVSAFSFLRDLPANASLEGFLFPDTYTISTETDALQLLNIMLQNFDRRFSADMRQNVAAQGMTIPQAVTLAAIVEREAVLPEEQPTIASVFLNRLAQDIKLDADPTIQYAVGYFAANQTWWKAPLSLDDLAIDSPYNTYLHAGLPPGPIANPGLGALQAVARPAETDFLFFVAECQGFAPGSHIFSAAYEQHLQNVENCRE
ncbi:MAG TPA: endolytic transglycosylase MltG [Anaerolineae bacterium]|nr:endolytic transglycosylase MltG [Anaerolineae bacterium]